MLRTCGARLHRALVAGSSIHPSGRFSTTAVAAQIKPAETPSTSKLSITNNTGSTSDLPTAQSTNAHGQQQSDIRTHHARLRKPKRPTPLLRDFFVGAVDTELLTYPEPITREDMEVLDASVRRHTDLLVGTPAAGRLNALRNAGGFGLDVPAAWGGKNCTVTELTRHAEAEALADVDLATALNAHRQVVRAIVECGNVEQQERYLPRLASGELMGAVAFYESASQKPTGYYT